jgi:hypothetical protein
MADRSAAYRGRLALVWVVPLVVMAVVGWPWLIWHGTARWVACGIWWAVLLGVALVTTYVVMRVRVERYLREHDGRPDTKSQAEVRPEP